MAHDFWKIVNNVIKDADILLLVLDARLPELTRNKEIENKVKDANKKLIYVLNKCDLIDQKLAEKYKKIYKPSVFVSSTEHLGTTKLRQLILMTGKREKKEKVVVGALGYPNTGKSSVINALKGKGGAKTSSISGYTKGVQIIKVDNRIRLLDTPGVIPFREEDKLKHVLIGTINFDKIKDPDLFAMELIKLYPDIIKGYYEVDAKDEYEVLEAIAKKLNKLKKGGKLDLELTGRLVLKDWQQGKIKLN